jgi:Resolvase, N terminal domain
MNVGYARTSTSDQTAGLDAQARDLKAAGAEKIFSEQVSSVAKRAKLAECLAFLREGDVLTVTKPDRLARSTAELLSIEADLTKRGIGLWPAWRRGNARSCSSASARASPRRRPPASTKGGRSASMRRRSGN